MQRVLSRAWNVLERWAAPARNRRCLSQRSDAPATTTTVVHPAADDAKELPSPASSNLLYRAPFFGESRSSFESLDHDAVVAALRSYGGLVREGDSRRVLLERLASLAYRRRSECIHGVVVSNAPPKTVVVASRRERLAKKIRKWYWVTRRFMAHDEEDRCRVGDRVTIRVCRPLSRRKRFVVVENFGSRERRLAQTKADEAPAERSPSATRGNASSSASPTI
ncbi:hypothetical protein CDCA_CDCA02G0763 [Cyanidium caldarium]|uniref:30S ribosomal protein S17, chloroplastic n=1 Tax=Cyanidium caldarium TaxID=2771 RepID=A0AAV9IS56_CYACA|nr:hypothetical protein CDCA_CDCA02G0763 [Cyanidium caldarium]